MSAPNPPVCDFDWPAPGFTLPATDGKSYALEDLKGERGLLLMFICNHCPYVQRVLDKIIRDARHLEILGIGSAAICSNDPVAYPEDNFDNMRKMAQENSFPFPYLHDADQEVVRAYGAVCTPDFFGFNADLGLQYHGRIDATRMNSPGDGMPRELYAAMRMVAMTGRGPAQQFPSIGCSIKWKEA